MSHESKSFLNLAGEFLVAGELNRRKIAASITYGSSKQADIFAFSKDRMKLARVEVKATDKKSWLVGTRSLSRRNTRDGIFWVLVQFSRWRKDPPLFYVLSGHEISQVARQHQNEYRRRHREQHGHDYAENSVPSVSPKDLTEHLGCWSKITKYLR
jgi:hypothetical protein